MKLTKDEKILFVHDGTPRPLSLARLRFHPTEAKLLGQICDRHFAVWDLVSPLIRPEKKGDFKKPHVPGTLHGPHERGWVRALDITADGSLVATGGSDRRIKLWKWENGHPAATPVADIAAHDGWVEAVAFSPDGKTLASASADKSVKLWDVPSLRAIATLGSHPRFVRDLCWSSDGKALISSCEAGRVNVWDAAERKAVRAIEFGDASNYQGQILPPSGAQSVESSADGRWLAVAGAKRVAVYDFATGAIVGVESNVGLQSHFAPGANALAAGGERTKVWEFDPAKWTPPPPDKNGRPQLPKNIPGAKEVATIAVGDFSLGVRFSPDGKKLYLGKNDGSVEVYSVTA